MMDSKTEIETKYDKLNKICSATGWLYGPLLRDVMELYIDADEMKIDEPLR